MDFVATMDAIAGLAGKEVAVTISGTRDQGYVLASLQGVLKQVDPPPASFDEAVAREEAVVFEVGEHWGNDVSFWPSRFVSAESVLPKGSVKVTTSDGVVLIGPGRPGRD